MRVPPLLLLVCSAAPAWAQQEAAAPATTATDAERIIVSHGISAFGDLKYPKDFPHFDYVNPDAPKGGTMSFRGTGARELGAQLAPFVGELSHALYLGQELQKAELAIALGRPEAYWQDKPLDIHASK